ncbi:MAG: DUF3857 and transglutaminase domain-containing protein, partial [Bacteroidales bacterium]|nr:DUF3857 and transglutaminase domain-containing protein [Candidatus Colimorpha onthohippi]
MMKNKFLLWIVCSLVAIPSMAQSHHSVVYDSTSVVMEESGLSHVAHHVRLRMLDRKGCASNNVLKMDYDPLSAYVEIQKVWVHRADGSTQQIRLDVFDYVKPSRSIFWNASQKMVQIGHLDPGDELEYVTYMKGFTYALLDDGSSDDQYIPPMRGHFYDIVPFWSNEPVAQKVYTVSVLNTKNLKYKIYGDDSQNPLSVSKTISGDRTVYTFTKRDIQPIKTERNMVASSDVFCKLLLSTVPNWESKSVWFYGVNESYGSYTPTAELQAKVSELLLGAKSEFDSLNILTHWVADNMRYCGLSMGKGEGYTHHNVTMNFTDRCGVCKGKASLLIAMLRAAGFEAYPVMTMAGSRIDDIPADQFNHSVAVVRLKNGKFQLIDPTWVPNVRELWSSAEQQQGYLIGSPEGLPLMTTPLSDPENHYIRISGHHKIT